MNANPHGAIPELSLLFKDTKYLNNEEKQRILSELFFQNNERTDCCSTLTLLSSVMGKQSNR